MILSTKKFGFTITLMFVLLAGVATSELLTSKAFADDHLVYVEYHGDVRIEHTYDDQDIRVKSTHTYRSNDATIVSTIDADLNISSETTRVTEIPDPEDATSTIRTVSITKNMHDLALPYETTVINEFNSVITSDGTIPNLRTKTTKTYSKSTPRRLLKKVQERKKLLLINEDGEPVYETTRTTSTNDGVVREKFDEKTQQWMVIDATTSENNGSNNGSGSATDSKRECAAQETELAELIDEITDTSDQIDTLKLEIDDLSRYIVSAKSWSGLPRHYQLRYRKFEDESKNYWECPVCDGPEKSIVNQFHRWACIGSSGPSVIHSQPLPTAVTDYQFIYELKLRARRKKALDGSGLCGKGVSPAGVILFTNWGLRDDYLDTMEPALKRKTKAFSAVIEQFEHLKSHVREEQEAYRKKCKKSARTIPRLSGPARPQQVEPDKDCKKSGLLGGVECVDERMGE